MAGQNSMAGDQPFDLPADRHYDGARHLWAKRDAASGRVRIGIDTLGLESLGELAYVSLEGLDTTRSRGQPMGTLEAAKMTSAIVAPVSGTIVQRNDAVLRNPALVNQDPYDAGWLVELEPTNWDEEAEGLISGNAIGAWAAAESERLRAEERGRTSPPSWVD